MYCPVASEIHQWTWEFTLSCISNTSVSDILVQAAVCQTLILPPQSPVTL